MAECFSDQGRPAEPVRFMIGVFMLKHTYALSDEQVWNRWVNDPYFQYFTGEEFFQHIGTGLFAGCVGFPALPLKPRLTRLSLNGKFRP